MTTRSSMSLGVHFLGPEVCRILGTCSATNFSEFCFLTWSQRPKPGGFQPEKCFLSSWLLPGDVD